MLLGKALLAGEDKTPIDGVDSFASIASYLAITLQNEVKFPVDILDLIC